jgi:predicted  nucleic acid-binding Zn-ribbon protein
MKAQPAEQERLLDLQQLDTRLDQLAHRARSLPELAELVTLEKEAARLRDLHLAAETHLSDLERERRRVDTDVEQVRTRARRDQERLDSGRSTNAKELMELQSELASLARRQSDLEDVELEVMERIEVSEAERDRLSRELAAVEERAAATTAARDEALSAVEGERALTAQAREAVVRDVPADLLALYERIRASSGGIGAAELKQRRCGGCRLELNTVEMGEFRSAAPDEVVRHEECGRILVRTAESGL